MDACTKAIALSKNITNPHTRNTDFVTMIDATGKIPSGFFEGNILAPGAYDECYTVPGSTYGRLKLDLSPLAPALKKKGLTALAAIAAATAVQSPIIGLCIPSPCADVIEGILPQNEYLSRILIPGIDSSFVKNGNGTNWTALIKDFTIVPKRVDISAGGAVLIAFMALLAVLSVLGSVVSAGGVPGCCKTNYKSPVLQCFSLTENLSTLCALEQRFPKTAALEGMRVLSMQWVIIGHTLLILIENNVDNPNHMLQSVVTKFAYQPLVNATVSVDTFFVISGFLLAYVSMRKLRKMAAKNPSASTYVGAIFLFTIHRWLRLVPVLGVVMLASAELVQSVGNGPLWTGAAVGHFCREYWWTNLLFINNLYPSELSDECVGQSWYLANDMQFFILGVIALITFVAVPFFRERFAVRVAILSVIAIASCVLRMAVIANEKLWPTGQLWGPMKELPDGTYLTSFPHNTDVHPDDLAYATKVNNHMYVQPWYRIATYIVGVIAGLLLDELDARAKADKAEAATEEADLRAAAGVPGCAVSAPIRDTGVLPAIRPVHDTSPAYCRMGDAEANDEAGAAPLMRATSSGTGTLEYVPLDAEETASMLANPDAAPLMTGPPIEPAGCILLSNGEGMWYAGAVVALGVMVAILYCLHPSYNGHPTGLTFNVLYHGLNRLIWSCAIAFFVLACALGRLRFVNKLLSLPIFLPLSKLSYSCYLIHITILQVSTSVDRVLLHYTDYSLVTLYVGTILMTYVGAAILFVLVEVPAARLEALVLPKL